MKKTTKKIDCVALKHALQAEIYEDIKDLSPAQEIAYFQARAARGPLRDFYRALRQPRPSRRRSAKRRAV